MNATGSHGSHRRSTPMHPARERIRRRASQPVRSPFGWVLLWSGACLAGGSLLLLASPRLLTGILSAFGLIDLANNNLGSLILWRECALAMPWLFALGVLLGIAGWGNRARGGTAATSSSGQRTDRVSPNRPESRSGDAGKGPP